MSEPDEVAGDQLRAIVERIEQVEEEIKELTEARKEIYLEAKGNGFDAKILREVIRVRKQDQKAREEQQSLLDVSFQAIKGGRSVAKAAGLGRQVPVAVHRIRRIGACCARANPGGYGGQEVEEAGMDRARGPRTQIPRGAE